MKNARMLSVEEARTFYDRFGKKQDRQSFYEAPALGALAANADLGAAHSVFELGCGTGRYAAELLRDRLPPDATYLGVDLSATMVGLASERLAPFGARARAATASGDVRFPLPDASVDRVLSTYVLDLLPEDRIREALSEARRVLRPGGLACFAGITPGTTPASRALMAAWRRLFEIKPGWLGGCRPLALAPLLGPAWRIRFHRVVVAWAVASEVLVAAPVRAD